MRGGRPLTTSGCVIRGIVDIVAAMEEARARGAFTLSVSATYTQVYNNRVSDLLTGRPCSVARESGEITGARSWHIRTMADAVDLLREGEQRKTFEATAMNGRSSRAHTIFALTLTQVQRDGSGRMVKSNLFFVDLAGSERIGKSGVTGVALEEAKAINLSREAEPEIYDASMRFGTVLENVTLDPHTKYPNFDDGSLTENTRSSYPLHYIPGTSETGMGGQPENIVMLTADAFGVLPPISQLTADQAMYHFLSGYTARLAGTERGVDTPQATFSTCFGAPFLPRHPTEYAKLLGEKIQKSGAKCWLVNTGWSGGAYGTGERMKIAHTRTMVRAVVEGKLSSVAVAPDPNFGLLIPDAVPDVPKEVLNPKETWADKGGYDSTARDLAQRFEANFEQFNDAVTDDVKAAGIHAAA